jgi:hypothetical protein
LHRIEIHDQAGPRRTVELTADVVTAGADPSAGLRLDASGLAPAELRFVRTDRGYRVEPARPGAMIAINGEQFFAKDLAAGDTLELGGVRLRWLDAAVEPVAAGRRGPRTAAARAPAGAEMARSRAKAPPRRDRFSRLLASCAIVVALGALALALRVCSESDWPRTPAHYLDLALQQLDANRREAALASLEFALREATGSLRTEALQLQQRIRDEMTASASIARVQTAREELELLRSFVDRYLRADPTARPAARELVGNCAAWLQQHGEVCRAHPDGRKLVADVELLRDSYAAAAALGTPDEAADVLFAARARLRFQWREYRSAIALLDEFLAAHADAEAVRKERAAIAAEGQVWFDDRIRFIDKLLDRGDVANAERDLRALERWSLLPEWTAAFEQRQQRIGGPR